MEGDGETGRGEAQRSAPGVYRSGLLCVWYGTGDEETGERERRGGERREEEEDTERRGNTEDIEDGMYVVRRAGAAYVTVYTA